MDLDYYYSNYYWSYWGALSSNDGERGAGAFSGAIMGGMGCGFILFRIFLWGLGIMLLLWLFGSLFG